MESLIALLCLLAIVAAGIAGYIADSGNRERRILDKAPRITLWMKAQNLGGLDTRGYGIQVWLERPEDESATAYCQIEVNTRTHFVYPYISGGSAPKEFDSHTAWKLLERETPLLDGRPEFFSVTRS